jgi:hypothetical protein
MAVRMSYKLGRKAMSHRVENGKLEHFIRGWDCICTAINVGEPDWRAIDAAIEQSDNPNALELHIMFRVNTSDYQK